MSSDDLTVQTVLALQMKKFDALEFSPLRGIITVEERSILETGTTMYDDSQNQPVFSLTVKATLLTSSFCLPELSMADKINIFKIST